MAAQMRSAKKVLVMSIEEKAKAYDEALEKVRPLYERAKKDDSPIWATYEHLFPQLAESEDERIRRDIIHYILYKADGVSEEQEHSWIAYLEKQKEPLTPEEKMNHPLYLEGFDVGREVGAVVAKPAEWSDSFEENIRNLLHDKLTWHSDDGSISTTVFIDDKTIKDIVMGIWFYVGKEAMKNPNVELPKAEWSEEDEEMRFACIDIIEHFPNPSGTVYGPWGDCINWLKSLKNRGKSPKSNTNSTWKPSEKQMGALKRAVNKLAKTDMADSVELSIMYNNLLKRY